MPGSIFREKLLSFNAYEREARQYLSALTVKSKLPSEVNYVK